MNYISKSPAQDKAERIARRASELANHTEAVLRALYAELTNDADPQAIFDAFGPSASKVLADYLVLQTAVAAINPDSTVPAPDPAMFAANQDGSVTYTAPPEPEIVEE